MNSTELEALVAEQGRRLTIAESEIAALKANQGGGTRAAAPAAKPASAPVRDAGVQFMRPVVPPPIALPSEEQFRKLADVVFSTYPTLRPWTPGSSRAFQDEQDFIQQFSAAFTFVAHQGRVDEIDSKHAVTWWADEATEWHRLRDVRQRISGSAFLVACLAAGDVSFQRSDQFGNVWGVALVTYHGRKATEAWRNVLRGELRRPMPGIHKAPEGNRFSVRPG